MNHIVLVGSVDRLPEKRVSPEGVATTSFKLKVVRPARGGSDSPEDASPSTAAPKSGGDRFDFIPVLALRRTADVAADFRAGEIVAVEGRLETFQLPGEQYKNGVRVFADSVSRLGAASPAPAVAVGVAAGAAAVAAADQPPAAAAGSYSDDAQPDFDTDIPF
jgi:single-stranded DNA-binding protein